MHSQILNLQVDMTMVKTALLVVFWPTLCLCQATLRINFDGPPNQVAGSQVLVQNYFESAMDFHPIPGSDGFARVWTGMPSEWPNNGTPYLQATMGDSLTFNAENGSSFGVMSVDLAAFSSGLPNYTVNFTGYRLDGSTIAMSFSGSGTDFQTFNFGSDWSAGLTRVEIPNYGWSLDNLVVAIPEPSTGAFFVLGAATLLFSWRQRK